MEDILGTTFVPINWDAKDLFYAQQKYVFQLFITNLKTDKGKELVKQYKHIFGAQSIWRDLLAHLKIYYSQNKYKENLPVGHKCQN